MLILISPIGNLSSRSWGRKMSFVGDGMGDFCLAICEMKGRMGWK